MSPPSLDPIRVGQASTLGTGTRHWQEIIEFLGGAALFGAVIAYLGKTGIDAFVSGRIESYKKNLERIAAEHSVRFQRLHAERADIIKTFYEQLSRLDEVLSSTLAPFQSAQDKPLPEKVQLMSKHFNETREYFVPRRVFFDEHTCEQVDRVLAVARGIFFDITAYEIGVQHPQSGTTEAISRTATSFGKRRAPPIKATSRH